MNKNVYKLKDYTGDELLYNVEPIYLEGDSLKEIFIKYVLDTYDFDKDSLKIGSITIDKLKVKYYKPPVKKSMKNRTILK